MILAGKKKRRRPPRPIRPSMIEREYGTAIQAYVGRVAAAYRPVFEALPRLLESNAAQRFDAEADDLLRDARDRLASTIDTKSMNDLAREFAVRTERHQRKQLERQTVAVFGANPFLADRGLQTVLDGFVSENVKLIRSVPEDLASEIEKAVTRAISSATPHRELAKELEAKFGYSRTRSRLIARDQVGKLYGQAARTRHKGLGLKRYIWRTVRDRRVRGTPGGAFPKAKYSHHDREGKVFSYDNPPPDGHPGQPILCRCYEEPIWDDVLNGTADPVPPPKKPETKPVASKKRQKKPRAPRKPKQTTPAPPPAWQPPAEVRRLAGHLKGADLSRPLSASAQQDIRDELADMMKPYGISSADVGRSRAGAFDVNDEPVKMGAGAFHDWDGGIVMSPRSAARAQVFAQEIASGVDYSARVRAAREAANNFASIDLAPLRAAGDAIDGHRLLVHETLHGYSPGKSSSYQLGTAGRIVEEVTTEVVARKVVRDSLGLAIDDLDHPSTYRMIHVGRTSGNYQGEIDAVVRGIRTEFAKRGVALTEDEVFDLVEEVSFAYKRLPPDSIASPVDTATRFASLIDVESVAAKKGVQLVPRVVDSTRDWIADSLLDIGRRMPK